MWPFRDKRLSYVELGETSKKWKPSTFFVVPCMFVFMSYAFMVVPLVQERVILITCNNFYLDSEGHNTTYPYPIIISDDIRCDRDEVSSSAANWNMYLSAANAAASILTTGTLGAITDKHGRKFALIAPAIGGLLQAVALSLTAHFDLSLPYFFIPQVIFGLCGGATTFLMAAFSYSADCSNLAKRSIEIGLLEAALFLGGTIGPIAEGYLVENYISYGLDIPLFIFGGGLVLVIIWAFVIPESLTPDRRASSVSWKRANIFGALSILISPSVYGDRWTLLVLGVSFSIAYVNILGFTPVMISYTKYVHDLHWHDDTIGNFIAVDWLLKGLAILFIVPICMLKFRKYITEIGLAQVGFFALSSAFVLYAFAFNTGTFFAITVIGGVGGICIPVMRGLFSMNVRVDQQGGIFSAISSLESLFGVVSPIVYNSIYSASVPSMPNLAFLVMAGANVLPVLLLFILKRFNSQTRILRARTVSRATASETQPIQPAAPVGKNFASSSATMQDDDDAYLEGAGYVDTTPDYGTINYD